MKTNNELNNNGLTQNFCRLTSFIKLFCKCYTNINLNIKQPLDKYLNQHILTYYSKKLKPYFLLNIKKYINKFL